VIYELKPYILGIILSTLGVLNYPPEVACEIHCATLIRLLEELASMQCSLGNERVVILFGESTTPV